ncbi:MAG: hypothetical protein HN744_13455 [Halieaceae bacterium]|jgi:hypothetical protein|nr:hypothetical protein [Halieaceae bacterium]
MKGLLGANIRTNKRSLSLDELSYRYGLTAAYFLAVKQSDIVAIVINVSPGG